MHHKFLKRKREARQKLRRFRPLQHHQDHIARITNSGYTRPVNRFMLVALRAFCRLWAFIQVGRIEVVGEENINPNEWVIACPNHRSLMDLPVGLSVLEGQYFGLAAAEILAKFGGIPAMVLTRVGIIPVDRSRGGTVIKTSVHALIENKRFALAGEGKINEQFLGEFRPGAAIIAERAANLLHLQYGAEVPVGIQPIHVKYIRPQGSAAKSYLKLGLKYRGGAVVTFLPTQYYDYRTPRTADEFMIAVRDQINALETVE